MISRCGALLCMLICLGGCSLTRTPAPGDADFSTVGFLHDHQASAISEIVLVPASSQPAGRALPYHSQQVWAYVIKYAPGGNDCPDGQFDSDCAHFQSHALAAGGIRVNTPSASCKLNLSIRVKDLALAFDNASQRYENVHKFLDYHQARRGDFCFLPRIVGGTNDHMMLLSDTPDPEGAFVWSHTNNRTGTHAPFDPVRCVFYRIDDR